MAKILSLKKFFLPAKEASLFYKRRHFLNALDRGRLEEILLYAEAGRVVATLPQLQDKNLVVFNDQRHKALLLKLQSQDCRQMLAYGYRGVFDKQEGRFFSVLGDVETLSLRRHHPDVVLCPFVLEDSAFCERVIKNLAGYLRNGSRLLLSLRHPFLENVLYNQNPAEQRVCENSVSRYFQMLKENHFYTEEVLECPVDMVLKPFFTDPDHDYYHEYKNTPLVLVFKAVKYEKTKKS